MKWNVFQAVSVSVLQYGCTTWTLIKMVDQNYTRMLCAVLNTPWKQHPTKQQLYSHLPPILLIKQEVKVVTLFLSLYLYHFLSTSYSLPVFLLLCYYLFCSLLISLALYLYFCSYHSLLSLFLSSCLSHSLSLSLSVALSFFQTVYIYHRIF